MFVGRGRSNSFFPLKYPNTSVCFCKSWTRLWWSMNVLHIKETTESYGQFLWVDKPEGTSLPTGTLWRLVTLHSSSYVQPKRPLYNKKTTFPYGSYPCTKDGKVTPYTYIGVSTSLVKPRTPLSTLPLPPPFARNYSSTSVSSSRTGDRKICRRWVLFVWGNRLETLTRKRRVSPRLRNGIKSRWLKTVNISQLKEVEKGQIRES